MKSIYSDGHKINYNKINIGHNHSVKVVIIMIDVVGAVALSRASFGAGSGQIWLDNVACTGNERRLIDCTANPLGSHNCQHSEDAGVRCRASTSEYMWVSLSLLYAVH